MEEINTKGFPSQGKFISLRELTKKLIPHSSFTIPYYQRDYRWGSPEYQNLIINLINQLKKNFEISQDPENEKYTFLDQFTFCKESKKASCDIVDGQQRITTLILILFKIVEHCTEDIKIKFYNWLYREKDHIEKNFIIQENTYLTKSILHFLENTPDNIYSANIKNAINVIDDQLKRLDSYFKTPEKWNEFYEYIMSHIGGGYYMFYSHEDAFDYYINHNVAFMRSTQLEVFYTALSEIIRKYNSYIDDDNKQIDITTIKNNIKALAKKDYINLCEIQEYSDSQIKYNITNRESKKITSEESIIYIFLKIMFRNMSEISDLQKDGIGTWMAYKNNSLIHSNNPVEIQSIMKLFNDLIDDFDNIYKNLIEKCSSEYIKRYKAILDYDGNKKNVLTFIYYLLCCKYEKNKDIDFDDACKRYLLALVSYYLKKNPKSKSIKFYDYLLEYLNLGEKTYKISDFLKEITSNISNIFQKQYLGTANFNVAYSGSRIDNESDAIKFILCLEEALLRNIANKTKISDSLSNLLREDYTIEHFLTADDCDPDAKESRFKKWQSLYNTQNSDNYFMILKRSKFLNLSLLDNSTNSKLGKKSLHNKVSDYINSIYNGSKNYLIQLYFDNSDVYTNTSIQTWLINNNIINENQNFIINFKDNNETWKHSENIQDSMKLLIKKSIEALVTIDDEPEESK